MQLLRERNNGSSSRPVASALPIAACVTESARCCKPSHLISMDMRATNEGALLRKRSQRIDDQSSAPDVDMRFDLGKDHLCSCLQAGIEKDLQI